MNKAKKLLDEAIAKSFSYAAQDCFVNGIPTEAQVCHINYLTGVAHGMKAIIDELEKGEIAND